MEQAQRTRAHLERVLLVCGEQNSGKSRLLRQMLSDERLGGEAPVSMRVGSRFLSRERKLAVRFTSPHEMGEDIQTFVSKIDRETETAWHDSWRLNYASAIQPRAANQMPGIVDVCQAVWGAFKPERIRVVILAPDIYGDTRNLISNEEVDALRTLDIEVLTIDARMRADIAAEPGNIRILADYFDFS